MAHCQNLGMIDVHRRASNYVKKQSIDLARAFFRRKGYPKCQERRSVKVCTYSKRKFGLTSFQYLYLVQSNCLVPNAILSRCHPYAHVLELYLRRVLLCVDRILATPEEKLWLQRYKDWTLLLVSESGSWAQGLDLIAAHLLI